MNMKKFFKSVRGVLLVAVVLVLTTAGVYAGSGGYNSTYDMTGGVYQQQVMTVGSNPTFECDLHPTLGYSGAIIRVFLEKDAGLLGYQDVAQNDVSSVSPSASVFTQSASGTYRFYLRNYTGNQMTGNCTFTWSW